EGSITFTEFVSRTRSDFVRMANYLLRRWVSPAWFSVDDVVQELYLGAWNHIWRYEPILAKGITLARYVVYNAMTSAKAQLHKAPGATIPGPPDKKKSAIETPLTAFGDDREGESLVESLTAEAPRAEDALVTHEEWRERVCQALRHCETPDERTAILA